MSESKEKGFGKGRRVVDEDSDEAQQIEKTHGFAANETAQQKRLEDEAPKSPTPAKKKASKKKARGK